MANKTQRRTMKAKKISDLPVAPDTARQVKGGVKARPVAIGDIKGESTDKDHKDW